MRAALLLIDIQKDYFSGGRAELYLPNQAAQNARLALEFFRQRSLPVIHVQHVNARKDAAFFIEGTGGTDFYDEVQPLPGEPIVVKHTPDSFYQTDLAAALEREKAASLVVCGMMSHMCIDTTVRSAKAHGYETTLLSDACATKDLYWQGEKLEASIVHKVFMASLSGLFAKVCTTRQCCV